MSIHKQLNEIQAKLKAPKSQFNSFGKYHYRNCEDILEAVKPLLGGLSLTLSDDIKAVGDRVYVEATASVSDGEHTVSVKAYAREAETKKGMDDSQITGSASSYARKYALNGLFAIDDTKDADTKDNRGSSDMKEVVGGYTPEQKAKFDNMVQHKNAVDLALEFWVFRKSVGDEVYAALNGSFEQGKKMEMKQKVRQIEQAAVEQLSGLVEDFTDIIERGDLAGVEEFSDLDPHIKKHIFEQLTPEQQHNFKELKKTAA